MIRRCLHMAMAGIAALTVGPGVDAGASFVGLPDRDVMVPFAAVPIAAAVNAPPVDPVTRPMVPTALVSDKSLIISRSTDGLFYVNASIDGNAVKFLVDTGANVTVLTRADAERLGLGGASARSATMQTAGGPTAMRWTKISQMNIADKPVTNVDAAIIDQGIQVSLLGQNVLSRLDGMTFSGDQLQFH